MAPWDFLPDLLESNTDNLKVDGRDGWKKREAPKPLHVVQPEGVSFKMDGNVLEWQKWKMHIGWSTQHLFGLHSDHLEQVSVIARVSPFRRSRMTTMAPSARSSTG